MICESCGGTVQPGDEFCQSCGAKVEEKKEVTETKPVTETAYTVEAPTSQIMEPVKPEQAANKQGFAVAGLVLGIICLIAWLIPLLCYVLGIVGIIMSVKGMKSTGKGMAVAGLVMCIVGLVLALGTHCVSTCILMSAMNLGK